MVCEAVYHKPVLSLHSVGTRLWVSGWRQCKCPLKSLSVQRLKEWIGHINLIKWIHRTSIKLLIILWSLWTLRTCWIPRVVQQSTVIYHIQTLLHLEINMITMQSEAAAVCIVSSKLGGWGWGKLRCFLVPKSQTMMHTNSYLHPLLVILWSHSWTEEHTEGVWSEAMLHPCEVWPIMLLVSTTQAGLFLHWDTLHL